MENIFEWIQELTGFQYLLVSKISISIIIIFVLWILRFIVLRIIWKNTDDVVIRYRWQKWLTYISVMLVFLIVGRVWFDGISSLATYLGLLSAGLAIALKDLVAGIAGWVFVLWRKPFNVGDRVQIGSYVGDIIDIRLFKFTMMEIGNWVDAEQSTGRLMHLPNGLILSEVITNYAQGFQFIWNEIPVLLTFESNWKKTKEILNELAEKHGAHLSKDAEKRLKEASKKYMIYYSNLTPTVYTTVKDSGVMLTIRYLIEPRKRRNSEQAIWEEILQEFSQHKDIDFAYPTQRFYDNSKEGKDK